VSVASRVAGWKLWQSGIASATGSMSPTFGTTTGPRVEIYVDESWIDISEDVRYASRITISGGRSDESSQLQRGTCKFTLNNRDGRYSPRNPVSPYYGKIGRNTAVRMSVDQEGTTRYRFHGEIVAWPSQWDNSGADVFVQVEGSGILRRLNQGAKPLRSSMYRTMTRETADPVRALWPCEDASGATSLASAVTGAASMTISGSVSVGAYSGYTASDPIPTLGAGSVSGLVPTYTLDSPDEEGNGPYLRARFLLAMPDAGIANGAVLFRIATTGTTARWDVIYLTTTNGTLRLAAYDTTGVQISSSFDITDAAINGKDTMVSVALTDDQGLGDVLAGLGVVYDDGTASTSNAASVSGAALGRATSVTVAPGLDCSGISVGHVFLQTAADPSPTPQDLIDGHKGESAFTRISRLCAEEGINFSGTDPGTGTTTMGPQTSKTIVALLTECVEADLGMLYEPRDQLGLGYRPRVSLYNQAPKVTLSYTTNDLLSPAVPVDDDQQTQNDIEVKREGGSSARAILTTGALSVLRPPAGVGLYDTSDTINVLDDGQLADQASWRLHLGTVDEPRYPELAVHLQRPSFASSYDLTAAALEAFIGDRVLITDQPVHQGGQDISVLVQSFTEQIDQFEHTIHWNGAPESPYQVAVADLDEVRADTSGSALRSAISDTDTTVVVSTTDGRLWTTTSSEFPFNVTVGGETVTVTAIAGADGEFETGVGDWTPTDCTISQSNSFVHAGLWGAFVLTVGTPSQADFRPTTPGYVTAGTSYTATMWGFSSAGYSTVSAAIDWRDADGNYMSTSAQSFSLPAATWTKLTITATAPAGAARVSWGPTITGNPPNGTAVYFDSIEFTPIDGQAFTVTRSVNGITKSHPAGTAISLLKPAIAAL
jgi:hypothetical protein